ncbi:OmpA family protein [uncultured Brachyspira sp.]|uniref:OmpA family protein n=1 Tax=uncultured Brachyspira sp. TaxID=221953 RepID=UPI0026130498|nr:OmpA family protein [uncultured Brachyspira sp.]
MKNNILILISMLFFAVSCSTASQNVIIVAFSKQQHAVIYNDNSEYKDIPEKNNNTAAVKKTDSGNTILITDNVINFDFDSYELKDEYNDGINEIYSYLNNNKNAILIIEGHADSIGDSNYNIYLSENRARAIFDELREKGIERRRLRYIGYGSTRSDQNYDKNRKCQFVVINSADEEKAYKEKNETDTIKLKK